MTSLDDYCQRHGLDRIDLIKMDIEGGEYDALIGARQLLRTRSVGCLFIEMANWTASRNGHPTVEISALLAENGYRLYRFTSRGLVPINTESIRDGETVVASTVDFRLN